MIPIDEYNRLTIAADANKLLAYLPFPKQEEGEEQFRYEDRVHREYNDISAIRGIFKSFGDAPGGFKEELQEIYYGVGAEYTYNDKFRSVQAIITKPRTRATASYFTVGAGFKMECVPASMPVM